MLSCTGCSKTWKGCSQTALGKWELFRLIIVVRIALLDLTNNFLCTLSAASGALVWRCKARLLGMGTVENSTVRFGFWFCFYGSVLSRFPKRFINDISWIRNYAMECVAELAWTCKFLYTSSLASFSMLRRLLRIVKVAREQEAPLWNGYLIGALDRHCEASSADSFITPPAGIENRTAWRGVPFQTG